MGRVSGQPFMAFANSSDFATGASDAGFTVVDGGTLPYALSSDRETFINAIVISPHTASDEFHYKLVSLDSDKVIQAVLSMELSVHTGTVRNGADQQFVKLPNDVPLTYSSNARYVGVAVDFGDTDALANMGIAGYYEPNTGN